MRHLRLGAVGIHGPRFWSAIPSRSDAIAMTSSCVVIPALIALLGLLLARFSVRQLIALRGSYLHILVALTMLLQAGSPLRTTGETAAQKPATSAQSVESVELQRLLEEHRYIAAGGVSIITKSNFPCSAALSASGNRRSVRNSTWGVSVFRRSAQMTTLSAGRDRIRQSSIRQPRPD